jgi:hypothetical protein
MSSFHPTFSLSRAAIADRDPCIQTLAVCGAFRGIIHVDSGIGSYGDSAIMLVQSLRSDVHCML